MKRFPLLEQFMLTAVFLAAATSATCADTSFSQCTEAGLPSYFCCGPSTTCIPLAANTTVLCCPTGQNCSIVAPITCDISEQNATLHPNNALKTTALLSTLETCSTGCCPFGYTCSNDVCVMNANQQVFSPTSSATLSSSTSTSTISTQTASSSPQTNSSTSLSLEKTCNKFPTAAVLAGFFPGLALGVLFTVGGVCLLGARRRRAASRRSMSSFGNISDPQPSNDMRTDFLRKAPRTPSSTSTPTRQPSMRRVRSIFRKSGSSNGTASSLGHAPPIPLNTQRPTVGVGVGGIKGGQRPVTPVLQREVSYEDINIFADGDTASALRERERQRDTRGSHQTTFTDMMERSGLAGLQKGQPYVYRGNTQGTWSNGSPKRRNEI